MVVRLALEHDAVRAFGSEQVAKQEAGGACIDYCNMCLHHFTDFRPQLTSIKASRSSAGEAR